MPEEPSIDKNFLYFFFSLPNINRLTIILQDTEQHHRRNSNMELKKNTIKIKLYYTFYVCHSCDKNKYFVFLPLEKRLNHNFNRSWTMRTLYSMVK